MLQTIFVASVKPILEFKGTQIKRYSTIGQENICGRQPLKNLK